MFGLLGKNDLALVLLFLLLAALWIVGKRAAAWLVDHVEPLAKEFLNRRAAAQENIATAVQAIPAVLVGYKDILEKQLEMTKEHGDLLFGVTKMLQEQSSVLKAHSVIVERLADKILGEDQWPK